MPAKHIQKMLFLLLLSTASTIDSPSIAQSEAPWDALASGNHVAIIRHALAPGYSDPAHFDLKNCKTQRNLNGEGRLQSEKIGALFRQNGISQAIVYSSQWCRCLETAELLDFGEVIELPALNSFFENFERKAPQTERLRRWIQTAPLNIPTILISHQVNISALTGYSPSSGEIVFIRREPDGTLKVVKSLRTLR